MDCLSRLEIEQACGRCVVDYTHCIDFGDHDGFATLFAEDATLHVGRAASNSQAEIRKSLVRRPKDLFSRHVASNIAIDVIDENNATGVSYMTLYRSIPSKDINPNMLPLVAGVGVYRDKFTNTATGWKFAERIGTFDLVDASQF